MNKLANKKKLVSMKRPVSVFRDGMLYSWLGVGQFIWVGRRIGIRTLVRFFVDCIGRLDIKKPPGLSWSNPGGYSFDGLSEIVDGFCHVLLEIDCESFSD